MEKNFWQNLPKPFVALAPMYDVTDVVFREIIAMRGKPDVFYTEFVSTDGLQSAGQQKLMHHLRLTKNQHPIVAQVFGTKPEKFAQTAKLTKELGFDGMDINMGCPDKNIIKGGSCAALFKTPELAKELVLASKEGGGKDFPISVKIRIGDTKIDWQHWIQTLIEAKPACIAIHLRTRKEMSKVPAHWEEMPKIIEFVKSITDPKDRPVIVGNGDIESVEHAKTIAAQTGCDGVMIGRGIFGNPWLFSTNKLVPSKQEKLTALLEHLEMYQSEFDGIKHYDIMKRHFKAYINGFDGAAELREPLYNTKSIEQALEIIKNYKQRLA
ncbi:MAG: tRNA-dihydrouridine synthase [Candidatus Doudnabacteria bacterium]